MSVSRAATRWDVRRKVAIETLKKRIEKLSKSAEAQDKETLKKAEATLAATQSNMGKGLSALK